MTKEFDVLLRVILVGDTDVGKTCLLTRYVDDQFIASCPATVGIDFRTKLLKVDGKRVKLQIWDTAGQERFGPLTKQYYRLAQGVVLIYDICKKTTFENIERWLGLLNENGKHDAEMAMVGNKRDLEEWREVTLAEGRELALKHNFYFAETSSYSQNGPEEVFYELAKRILEKTELKSTQNRSELTNGIATFEIDQNTDEAVSSSKRCCAFL